MKRCYVITVFLLILTYGVPANLFAQNWDIDILKNINPEHPNSWYWETTSSSAYYLSGAAVLGALVVAISSDNTQTRQNTAELFIHLVSSTLISETLKLSFNEMRPADRYPALIFVSSVVHGKSFPSGHTTLAFSTASSLALDYPKWYVIIPAYLWAGLVGYSRLYLGKHYPSDVLAGAAIGFGTSYISRWLTCQIFKPHQNKSKYDE